MRNLKLLCALLLIGVLMMAGTALAAGQTNPRRKHMEETLRWRDLAPRGDIWLDVQCVRQPTASQPTGYFTFTIQNDDGADYIFEYGIIDNRDDGGYVFLSLPRTGRSFTTVDLRSSGSYGLFVFLYRTDNSGVGSGVGDHAVYGNWVATGYYEFEFTGSTTLEARAAEIARSCRGSDQWHTMLNIHDWLTSHIYYDLNFEYYGADAMFRGIGVCDSYSKAFKMICNAAGITCERVISDAMNHAWNVVKYNGLWYQLDATWDDPAGATTAVSGDEHHDYFCLNDELMGMDHTLYDASYSPGCHDLAANYHIHENQWQIWGVSDYGGYYDENDNWHWTLSSILDQFQELMDSGETVMSKTWDTYWFYTSSNDLDIGGGWVADRHYKLFAYGMSMYPWYYDGEAVRVETSADVASQTVTLRITGWNIRETGTLTLPEDTLSVEESAFERVKATSLVINSGCSYVGANAFRNSAVRIPLPPSMRTPSPAAAG